MGFLTGLWRTFVAAVAPGGRRGTLWIPIELAVRLRTLQQGSLNVGNTRQNKANLIALATTEANGNANWARWHPIFSYKLQVDRRLVPGYVPPIGTNH